jgi:hypothetical protein
VASSVKMQSRQPDLLCAEFITFPAATVFLLLRVISRKITRVGFWWDDWFAILCYVWLTCTLDRPFLLTLISDNRRGMGHHDPLVYAIHHKDTSLKLTQYQGFREDSAYTQPTSRARPLKMQTRQPRNSSFSSNTSTPLHSFSPRSPS